MLIENESFQVPLYCASHVLQVTISSRGMYTRLSYSSLIPPSSPSSLFSISHYFLPPPLSSKFGSLASSPYRIFGEENSLPLFMKSEVNVKTPGGTRRGGGRVGIEGQELSYYVGGYIEILPLPECDRTLFQCVMLI